MRFFDPLSIQSLKNLLTSNTFDPVVRAGLEWLDTVFITLYYIYFSCT